MVSTRNARALERHGRMQKATAKQHDTPKTTGSSLPRIDDAKVIDQAGDWYDDMGKGFWRHVKGLGWVGYNEAQYKRHLKVQGYFASAGKDETASQVERLLVRLQHERRVDFAGEIAGYPAGIHDICGYRVLIPRGPRFPEPQRGRWDKIKGLLNELLGDQARYFYGWIKSAHVSLRGGAPWRPGQLLVVAGERDCGKSVLQNLITEMLGGRACKPYSYLTGKTDFNSNLFGAEHWMIEDEASSTDIRIRRMFGAMVKNVVVNEVQNFHPKGKAAFSTRPFLRMTMTLNDNPESLLVLPPIDEDLSDKVMLLHARPATFPYKSGDFEGRQRYRQELYAEIPAFLHAIERWELDKKIQCKRFGVRAYHDPELLAKVQSLSPESQLLQIIDLSLFWKKYPCGWRGSAHDLQGLFADKNVDPNGAFNRLCDWPMKAGTYLARLAKRADGRVRFADGNERCHIYDIVPPG